MILLLAACCAGALTRPALGQGAGLECPLPGGPDTADPATCQQYTACTWTPDTADTTDGPQCQLNDEVGYTIDDGPFVIHTGLEAYLRKKSDVTMFGSEVDRLHLMSVDYDKQRLGISLRDADADRYEVPLDLNLPPLPTNVTERDYSVNIVQAGSDLTIEVGHKGDMVVQMLPSLIYSDQFIETTLLLGSKDVYGFGENNHDHFKHDLSAGTTWPLFALDRPPGDGIENLYGVHPFFLAIEDDTGKSFGMLILNSNAMEYKLFQLNGTSALTYRTTGGILDMYLFFGDSPLDVLKQYHTTIGFPVMPSYWGLGFQLCRYGYTSTDEIRAVHQRTKDAKIPQDVQYSDIDYMDVRRDFTVDPKNFGDLPGLIKELQEEESVRFVLIYDPAIATDFGTYPPVDRGVAQDVFIKWMNESLVPDDQCDGCQDYVVGYVWPESKTVFPDFFRNKTVDWWVDEMREFLGKVGNVDGFWIDMNEPSSFGTNLEKPFNWPDDLPPWSLKCPNNSLDSPPYPTRFTRDPGNESGRLSDHTICMSTKHTNDLKSKSDSFRHYDVHSMYGWSESRATREAMHQILGGKRGMLFGRSTYPGAGRWVGHWLGDNTSRWKDLRRSLVGMFEFNMFGIPYVGADICGFNGNTTEDLCLRWMQLGAFYPFCRNHNTIGMIDQDPAVWDSVAAVSRDALGLRYRLLPYLYTLFWRAETFGETVVRPLAFEFPTDSTLRAIDTQFLWGSAVMVAPILYEDSITDMDVTFPAGEWYDLRTNQLAYSGETSGQVHYHVDLQEMIPVFARGGYILATQKNESTTALSRKNPFTFLVFGSSAVGMFFWDDGETENSFHQGKFYHAVFGFSKNLLDFRPTFNDTQWMDDPHIDEVLFYGAVSSRPSQVKVDLQPITDDDFSFADGVLTVKAHMDMAEEHKVHILP